MPDIQLVILGGGSRGRDLLGVVRDINKHPQSKEQYNVIGFLDNDSSKWGSEVNGIEVIGPLENASEFSDDVKFINTIGGPSYFYELPDIISETGFPKSDLRQLSIRMHMLLKQLH